MQDAMYQGLENTGNREGTNKIKEEFGFFAKRVSNALDVLCAFFIEDF